MKECREGYLFNLKGLYFCKQCQKSRKYGLKLLMYKEKEAFSIL